MAYAGSSHYWWRYFCVVLSTSVTKCFRLSVSRWNCQCQSIYTLVWMLKALLTHRKSSNRFECLGLWSALYSVNLMDSVEKSTVRLIWDQRISDKSWQNLLIDVLPWNLERNIFCRSQKVREKLDYDVLSSFILDTKSLFFWSDRKSLAILYQFTQRITFLKWFDLIHIMSSLSCLGFCVILLRKSVVHLYRIRHFLFFFLLSFLATYFSIIFSLFISPSLFSLTVLLLFRILSLPLLPFPPLFFSYPSFLSSAPPLSLLTVFDWVQLIFSQLAELRFLHRSRKPKDSSRKSDSILGLFLCWDHLLLHA